MLIGDTNLIDSDFTTNSPLSPVVRAPSGKKAMLRFLSQYLPDSSEYTGRFFELFLGEAAVFLFANPDRALTSNSNPEVMDLYRGINLNPGGCVAPVFIVRPNHNEPLAKRRWSPTGALADLGMTSGLSLNLAPNLSN